METYEAMEIEVIEFEAEDVITSSPGGGGDQGLTPGTGIPYP